MEDRTPLRIVMCCFINPNYLEETKVSIKSIREVGKFNGRITLLTDFTDVELKEYDVDIHLVPPLESVDVAAGYRLKVVELLDWDPRDIFLYLDTDILCVKNMQSFVDHAVKIDNRLHVYGFNELGLTQGNHPFPQYYGGSLTSDPHILNQPAWCSGILLFRPSSDIASNFKQAYSDYVNYVPKTKMDVPPWEQPFLCYTFGLTNMYTISLNTFVSEERYNHKRRCAKPPGENATFHHFNGYRSQHRTHMMKQRLAGLNASILV